MSLVNPDAMDGKFTVRVELLFQLVWAPGPVGQHENDYALPIFSLEAVVLVQRTVMLAKNVVTYTDMNVAYLVSLNSTSFGSTPKGSTGDGCRDQAYV